MSQVPISALPSLATPLNPVLQFEVAQGTTTSSKVTLSQILTDPIITGSPTITNFTLATHDHSDNSEGGQLTNTALVTGVFSAITGIGTQTQSLSMGIQNILQAGFIEMREISIPAVPAETAGRLYVKDVTGTTTLFFLDSLGVETDLLDIGTGTFLELAGGTMTGDIFFLNTGVGSNPSISVEASSEQTLVIGDNLRVPEIIFIGIAGWQISSDGDTDLFIQTPTGDGSHDFDIKSDTGQITIESTNLGNDFTTKFLIEQTQSLATSTAIALTIEAQIVDGTDESTNPVIAINARQAAADIDTRPIFGILNNGTNLWEISKEGIVTQQNDLDMGTNTITFDGWEIQRESGTNKLRFSTTDNNPGNIDFSIPEMIYRLTVDQTEIKIRMEQQSTEIVSTVPAFETDVIIRDFNDVAGNDPVGIFNFRKEGGSISDRPLFQIKNSNLESWTLDHNGAVTQLGDLTITGGNTISIIPGNSAIPNIKTEFFSAQINPTEIFNFLFSGENNDTDTIEYISIVVREEDVTPTTETGSIDFKVRVASSTTPISFLKLDGDANQITANTDLVMGTNRIEFTAPAIRIVDSGGNLQLFASASIDLFPNSTSEAYVFGGGQSNWKGKNMNNMGILHFDPTDADDLTVSIQRGLVANNEENDLQLDANAGGNIVLRVEDSPKWTLGSDGTVTQTGDLLMGGNDIKNALNITSTGSMTTAFIQIAGDTNIEPELITTFTQTTPSINQDIFTMSFEGQNTSVLTKVYGQIIVRQVGITDGSETGSIDFLVKTVAVATPVSILKLDGDANEIIASANLAINLLDAVPTIVTTNTNTTPAAGRIATMNFRGQNDTPSTKKFAEIEVFSDTFGAGTEDGRMLFSIIEGGTLEEFLELKGVNANSGSRPSLRLLEDTNLTFRNSDNTDDLTLEIRTDDNLFLENQRVKTRSIEQVAFLESNENATTTVTDISDLTFTLKNEDKGLGIITLFLLLDPNSNNQIITIEVILGGNVIVFHKKFATGNSDGDANPFSFTFPVNLTGQVVTVSTVTDSGTISIKGDTASNLRENASSLTVFEIF